MSKALTRFVGLALALAVTPTIANSAEPAGATLSNVIGEVSVNQGKEFAPAHSGMRLNAGDRVMVPDNGSATITFDDACKMDLGESRIVTVPAKSVCAGGAVAQQSAGPGQGGGGAAIGDEGHGNGGVLIMAAVVTAIDLAMLSEDDEETTSP